MTEASPSSPTHKRPPRGQHKQGGDTIKETFESIIMAFILAFVFRAFIVEAFVIPTGSMAPTLLGEHIRLSGTTTGYRFTADLDDQFKQRGFVQLPRPLSAIDPMSHEEIPVRSGTRLSAGDRILVLKYLYHFNEPRRWDVVVFKNPQLPQQNFIKRLIGLPGEEVWIIEGNIYVRSQEGVWRIARKTDRSENRHAFRVQRSVWQHLHDTAHISIMQSMAEQPWQPTAPAHWRMVGHHGFELTDPAGGELRFDVSRAVHARAGLSPYLYPYNHLRQNQPATEPIEDVRVEATIKLESDDAEVILSTTARTDRSPIHPVDISAVYQSDGTISLRTETSRTNGQSVTLASVQHGTWQNGRTRHLELWYVDQEASVWVDGKRVLTHNFDIPIEVIVNRPPLSLDPRQPNLAEQQPRISLNIAGSRATVERLQVDRDLYFSSVNPYRVQGRASIAKGIERQQVTGQVDQRFGEELDNFQTPLVLQDDEFFCLGDNSPMSHDGRYWNSVDPWIAHRYMPGGAPRLGVVPRDLMMGKAFFVYFPAPHRWTPQSRGIVPNFGDMRFIH